MKTQGERENCILHASSVLTDIQAYFDNKPMLNNQEQALKESVDMFFQEWRD